MAISATSGTGYKADGVITIGTSVDVGGINTGLKKITKSMNKISIAAKGIIGLHLFKTLGNEALNLASDLQEIQNVVDVSFEDMSYKIENFAETCIEKFGISQLTAKETAGQFAAMGKSMGLTLDEATSMAVELTGLSADFASFYNLKQEYAKTALSAVYTGETETLKRYGIVITEANLQEYALSQGITQSVSSMSARNKLILRYKYIMQATADMQGDFTRTSSSWANQVRVLQQRWEQFLIVLGNGMKTVLLPLVKVLNTLLQAVISFANVVGEILSKLFGISSTASDTSSSLSDIADSATDASDAEEDLADSTSDAASAAKKALGAYDKLNVIQQSTSSSSSDDTDTSDLFDLDFGDLDFGDSIISKIKDSIIDDINSLYELGQYINQKLIEAMESIDWDTIYQGARNFGTGLAEFLNGLISPELFYEVGKTIANSLNTALYAILEFGKEFDFENLGKSLQARFVGFFENFDFDSLKEAGAVWGKGIAEAVNGFFDPDSLLLVGQKFGEALNAAVLFAFNFLNTLDSAQVIESIVNWFNGIFETFDFAKLADTIDLFVKRFWELVISFFKTVDYGKIWDGFWEFISNLDAETWLTIVGIWAFFKSLKLASALKTLLLTTIANYFKEGIITAITTGISQAIVSDSVTAAITYTGEVGTEIGTALSTPIAEASTSVGLSIGTIISTISGIVAVVGGVITSVLAFIEMWNNGWNLAAEVIKDLGIAAVAVGAVILGVVTGPVAAAIAAVVALVSSLVIIIKDHWTEICEWFKSAWDTFISWGKSAIQAVVTFITEFVETVVGLVKNLFETAIDIVQAKFELIKELVSTVFNTIWNIISDTFSWIKDVVIDIIEVFGSIGTFLSDVFTGNWSNVWTDIVNIFSNIWTTIVDIAKGPINLVIDLINGMISAVESAVNYIVNCINSISFDVPDWVPLIGGSHLGFSLNQVSLGRVPKLAQGAVIPPNKEFMAVLGDQKSGTNIETPLDTMIDAFNKALDNRGTDSGDIVVEIDGKEVFRAVRNQNKEYKNTTGKSAFA